MQAIPSKARQEMIEVGGRLCRRLGLPRTTGQIYGLLYLSAAPLSLDDIVRLLGISKASASLGTRQLSSWGALRQVWVPGDRRDFFQVEDDLSGLLRAGYKDFIKPRLDNSRKRLADMLRELEAELAAGVVSREEYRICTERLRNLSRLQRKLQTASPFLEKFL